MTTDGLTRRHALTGAAVVGVGLPLLAACGGGDGSTAIDGGSTPSAGETLGPASDVPVGGGTVYADQKLVVTQPTNGEFKAFSAVCTHQGCLVANVDGGTINCTCHGSAFSIEDGSVQGGPAPTALAEVAVTVKDGEITTA
ncbi:MULTISPECIES: Rieske (2Fe-2S) protein [unclassified Nocardioides]|uniref:Rieske (2Fe-2S) protein n=1 Tax=unclassified Nocardioides TaxID=2615069 RepID=UPI0009F0D5D2|nr:MULTISPECIES: Rieske (2Fe-2S) protein [unclassified Nocardioides]GAW50455.1 Rieske (2Fe-2S) domain protein (Precursor) [Nocardioides sp. PD653-B2]GAW53894.1 Rieske (2Fe-2S) domain protein (Precursor) [Nocardioides sp. PD653]